MFFYKSSLSGSHNWLLHHYSLTSIYRCSNYIRGKVLDIGCGTKPYKNIFKDCKLYLGLEYSKTIHGFDEVDVIGNSLQLPFRNDSFDSLVSFQVMEHVPEPQLFLSEALKVLKPGGYFLLMTPFMWGEHEAPYDFFRYTRYGLEYLAKKAGFQIIVISPDTKYWATAVLRLNYYLLRFARGHFKNVIKALLLPVFFFDQMLAFLLEKLPHNYTVDTTSFTTILRKPEN